MDKVAGRSFNGQKNKELIMSKPLFKSLLENPEFIAGDDTRIREVLHPKNDGIESAYSLAHASLDPGKSSLPHALNEQSELYYILRGSGVAYINEEAYPMTVGDSLLIPKGAKQYMVNEGDEVLDFLCVVSPPWRKEDEQVF